VIKAEAIYCQSGKIEILCNFAKKQAVLSPYCISRKEESPGNTEHRTSERKISVRV